MLPRPFKSEIRVPKSEIFPVSSWQTLHTLHPRHWRENKFVYPVLSRRSRGISIGVNLNPDKVCNFDCIYCQVDRRSEAETKFVEIDRLLAEIDHTLSLVRMADFSRRSRFAACRPSSGDSTTSPSRAMASRRRTAILMKSFRRWLNEASARLARRENSADHKRQHVSQTAGRARPEGSRREQWRNLGEAGGGD